MHPEMPPFGPSNTLWLGTIHLRLRRARFNHFGQFTRPSFEAMPSPGADVSHLVRLVLEERRRHESGQILTG